MPRRRGPIGGYNIFFGRHASWIEHNVLADNEKAVEAAIDRFISSGFLEQPPPGYKPRDFVYFGSEYEHRGQLGVMGLLVAADSVTDKNRNLVVFAIQVPLSPQTARPSYRSNCYLTTEIYPAGTHSLIPVSYEFARGTVPAKRLNFSVSQNGLFNVLPEKYGPATGFKHFISVEYSEYGLFQLDFQLSVPHRSVVRSGLDKEQFPSSKAEFLSRLQQEVSGPLNWIENELITDRGTLAPENIDPAPFLNSISSWMAEVAYGNMAIFKQELDSQINPLLHDDERPEAGFAQAVEVPGIEEESSINYLRIARAVVQADGALAALLRLSQVGPLDQRILLVDTIPERNAVGTLAELRRADLIEIRDGIIALTELGDMIVHKLSNYRPEESSNVGIS